MKSYDLILVAAAAFFFLASGDSANDSEAINVALPAQYDLIWNQSIGLDAAQERETAQEAVHDTHQHNLMSVRVRRWLHHSVGSRAPIFVAPNARG